MWGMWGSGGLGFKVSGPSEGPCKGVEGHHIEAL